MFPGTYVPRYRGTHLDTLPILRRSKVRRSDTFDNVKTLKILQITSEIRLFQKLCRKERESNVWHNQYNEEIITYKLVIANTFVLPTCEIMKSTQVRSVAHAQLHERVKMHDENNLSESNPSKLMTMFKLELCNVCVCVCVCCLFASFITIHTFYINGLL